MPDCAVYSGTGLVPASLVFFSPIPDLPDTGLSGIPVVTIAEPYRFKAYIALITIRNALISAKFSRKFAPSASHRSTAVSR
jgi:hypothetical protein